MNLKECLIFREVPEFTSGGVEILPSWGLKFNPAPLMGVENNLAPPWRGIKKIPPPTRGQKNAWHLKSIGLETPKMYKKAFLIVNF